VDGPCPDRLDVAASLARLPFRSAKAVVFYYLVGLNITEVAAASTLRPPLGPGLMAKYQHELAALEGLGLTDLEMDDALTYLLSFVQANARAAVDAPAAQVDSAMTDEQWWAANAGLLTQVLDQDACPSSFASAAPTTPNTPTASGCSGCSTASPHTSPASSKRADRPAVASRRSPFGYREPGMIGPATLLRASRQVQCSQGVQAYVQSGSCSSFSCPSLWLIRTKPSAS